MCLVGSTRLCLICLLVYLWIPEVSPRTTLADKHVYNITEKQPATNSNTDTAGTDIVTKVASIHGDGDNKENVTEHDDHDHEHDDHHHDSSEHEGHDHDGSEHEGHDHDSTEHDGHDHDSTEHGDHDHEPEIKAGYFMSKLFSTYGNGINITFEGFEHLLERLGLGRIIHIDHSEECHKPENSSDFVSFHKSHNHSGHSTADVTGNKTCVEVTRIQSGDLTSEDHHEHLDDEHKNHEHSDDEHKNHEHSDDEHKHSTEDESDHQQHHSHEHKHVPKNVVSKKDNKEHSEECIPKETMLHLVGGSYSMDLTQSMFTELCPSLVYQIAMDTCNTHNHDHVHEDHQLSHDDHDHQHHTESKSYIGFSNIPLKVWGFSSIAVLIISLVGLLGVAVIPIMQKVFYNHMLQFLVAMAVGALSGDALLHLLPHAIQGGHGSGEGHHDEEGGHDNGPIYKGLCGLMGIYFFFLIERILTIVTQQKRQKKRSRNQRRGTGDAVGEKLAANDKECGEMMMSIHPNKALKSYAEQAHDEHCTISLDTTKSVSHQHGHSHSHHNHTPTDTVDAEENETMLSQSSDGHGHGHSHCRSDGVPDSIAAIAWMVILGDGIHNFSDGLAIGAAFASSITGGFSTSIAVFCHELPHEIGDFAMLLRAGMKPKQAIFYNCLSSVLNFIGMLIGVAIGNLENASLWIFAIVGGMFLYISLVDMLPEMTSVETKEGENPFTHLFLQCIGMMLGSGIMLIIALYEEKLKTVLD